MSWVEISTSLGRTCENPGINNTSSKVNPSPKNLFDLEIFVCGALRIVAMGKDRQRQRYEPNDFFCVIERYLDYASKTKDVP